MAGNNLRHEFDNHENTMEGGIQNSGWRSRTKLVNRYSGHNVQGAIQEICDYLASEMIDTHPGEGATPAQLRQYALNKYCIAARALDPSIGAVGLNRQDDFLTVAAYWWAANDQNITESTIEDRMQAFVDALAECQRKILARTMDYHNAEVVDQIVCQTGVINKFAEKFTCLHPDTTSVDIKIWAYEILRGLLGEYLLSQGANINELPNVERGIDIPDDVKQRLRDNVLLVLGEVADANVQVILDRQIGAIDYIGFLKEVPQRDAAGRPLRQGGEYVNVHVNMTPEEIYSLIENSSAALREAQQRGAQDVTNPYSNQARLNAHTVNVIKGIIRSSLPQQNLVVSRDHMHRILSVNGQQDAPRYPQFDLYTRETGYEVPRDLGPARNQERSDRLFAQLDF